MYPWTLYLTTSLIAVFINPLPACTVNSTERSVTSESGV